MTLRICSGKIRQRRALRARRRAPDLLRWRCGIRRRLRYTYFASRASVLDYDDSKPPVSSPDLSIPCLHMEWRPRFHFEWREVEAVEAERREAEGRLISREESRWVSDATADDL